MEEVDSSKSGNRRKPVARIGYFYAPEKDKWVRATSKLRSFSQPIPTGLTWMPLNELLPRHQEKLSTLMLLLPLDRGERKPKIVLGLGSVKWSMARQGWVLLWLYDEAWRKEL